MGGRLGELDGNPTHDVGVFAQIDDPRSPLTEFADDLIATHRIQVAEARNEIGIHGEIGDGFGFGLGQNGFPRRRADIGPV
jgi:hypothetical protein